MTTISIRKEVEVGNEFLSCIITTAVEGGIGYWSQVEDYKWGDATEQGDQPFAQVTIHEMAGGDEPANEIYGDDWSGYYQKAGVVLTMDMIAEALRKIASDEEIEYCGQSWRNRMVDAMIEDEAGDIDSGDADNIVQVALFKDKLVYG